MAGIAGFEPTNTAVKVRCLTAWRYPSIKWGERWDSNPRQPVPQTGALPTELRSPLMVRVKRFELLSHALEGRCSIQLS